MKQYIKLIIIALVLVAAIVGAVILYNNLSADYDPYGGDNIGPAADNSPETNDTADTSDTADTTDREETAETDVPAEKVELQIDDATFYDMDGKAVNLSDFAGKPMIVNFWATWCGPCKSEMPHFQKMYEEYGDRIEFIMVNATDGQRDTIEKVKEYISDNGYTFPVYCDSDYDAIMTYGVYAFPSTLMIFADGSLYGGKVGAITETQLQDYIDVLLGNK